EARGEGEEDYRRARHTGNQRPGGERVPAHMHLNIGPLRHQGTGRRPSPRVPPTAKTVFQSQAIRALRIRRGTGIRPRPQRLVRHRQGLLQSRRDAVETGTEVRSRGESRDTEDSVSQYERPPTPPYLLHLKSAPTL